MPFATTSRNSRKVLTGCLYALLLAGCPQPPPAPDSGRRDTGRDTTSDNDASDIVSIDSNDAEPPLDATNDIVPVDDTQALDTPTPMDTVMLDAVDTATDSQGADSTDMGAVDSGPPSCMSSSGGMICNVPTDCATGEQCIPTGCGTTKRCQPAGRACADDRDCMTGLQHCDNDVCVANTTSDCGDTRACPFGYLCEGTPGARTCVNRRKSCRIEEDCPYGSSCYTTGGLAPFCVVVPTRCNDTFACLFSAQCIDVDNDSIKECVPFGMCLPSDCPDAGVGTTCEMPRNEFGSSCGPRGICSAQRPCGPGLACVDYWNTGVPICHPTANTCAGNASCPVGQLCFDVNTPETPGGPGCR